MWLIRTITHHRFELESQNLHHACIIRYSRLLLKMGVIDLDLQCHLAILNQETAFNVALVYWSRQAKRCYTSQTCSCLKLPRKSRFLKTIQNTRNRYVSKNSKKTGNYPFLLNRHFLRCEEIVISNPSGAGAGAKQGSSLAPEDPWPFYMLWVMYSTETCHSDIWRPQEPSGLWIKRKHGLLFVI